MKAFDQETFENILSSKGVKIADYVHKRDAFENEDLILRPLEVNDHTKGLPLPCLRYFTLLFPKTILILSYGYRVKINICN